MEELISKLNRIENDLQRVIGFLRRGRTKDVAVYNSLQELSQQLASAMPLTEEITDARNNRVELMKKAVDRGAISKKTYEEYVNKIFF